MFKIINLTFFLVYLAFIHNRSYNYTTCSTNAYRNTANFQCINCSANQIPNNYQTISISCQCSNGYVVNVNTCTPLTTSNCGGSNNNFYALYALDGTISSSITTCTSCAGNAYPDNNATSCIPCGIGMSYSSTQGCYCITTSEISSQLGCFPSTSYLPATYINSNYVNQLRYLFPACATYNDVLSCSYLINLCAFSLADMSKAQCGFFASNSKSNFLNADQTSFKLTFSKGQALKFKIISYLATGNYLQQKTLHFGDIMRCGIPYNTQIAFNIGTNIRTSCSFDFEHLIKQRSGLQFKPTVYQLKVQGDGGIYYDVPVYMPGSTQAIRRFFLEDYYSIGIKNILKVMTKFTLSFTLNNNGQLASPKLTPIYSSITIQNNIAASSPGVLNLEYEVVFDNDLTSFWNGAMASFITISVVALIHSIIKTYIGYLNKFSAVKFFFHFAGIYSLWLFYYLFCLTGYWFLFTKTTTSSFIFLPPKNENLYAAFYILVSFMVILRIIWVIVDKSDKLNTQVFMINWQRNQYVNSWRQIFIINSLAQFYTYRTISTFWMLAILLFFTNGVGWEALAAQTTLQELIYFRTLIQRNRILLYFLGCSILLAVGTIFKILRRISVLFWPYPFEDFADYCSATNISFLFIKKRTPHAYYLHASLPDRTQATYKQINQSIRKGLQKNRSIASQLPSLDSLHLYNVYLSKDIQDKHTQMLKKVEDEENSKRTKYMNKNIGKKKAVNLRQQFIQNKLKPHLEGMNSRENNNRRKSMLQNFCGLPPLNLREGHRNKSQVFFDDSLQLVNEVFPNGNQFQEIHTIIVIFLGWLTIINSIPIAAFLTYFTDQYVIRWWIEYSCRVNLQEMTKVKRGFML